MRTGWVIGAIVLIVLALVVILIVAKNRGRKTRLGTGLSVHEHPADTAPIDAALNELTSAVTFFERRRSQAKYKAENVLVGTRVANGCIAVLGVLVTFEGWSKWGIVSTALSALVAGLTEWDAHYRHRELWIERTVVLSKLQNLLRDARYQRLRGISDPDVIADEVMAGLKAILDEDLRSWTAMRGDTEDVPKNRNGGGSGAAEGGAGTVTTDSGTVPDAPEIDKGDGADRKERAPDSG